MISLTIIHKKKHERNNKFLSMFISDRKLRLSMDNRELAKALRISNAYLSQLEKVDSYPPERRAS